MLKFSTQKLGNDNYVRPVQTYTDKLTVDEIESKLEDYVKVEDLYKIPVGTHLRYFKTQDGARKFCTGGSLVKSTGLPEYLILTNGVKSWSAQTKDTIFFRKLTLKEIKETLQNKIDSLIEDNRKLKEQNSKLNIIINKQKKQVMPNT